MKTGFREVVVGLSPLFGPDLVTADPLENVVLITTEAAAACRFPSDVILPWAGRVSPGFVGQDERVTFLAVLEVEANAFLL
jgi:hypothetical protein